MHEKIDCILIKGGLGWMILFSIWYPFVVPSELELLFNSINYKKLRDNQKTENNNMNKMIMKNLFMLSRRTTFITI